MSRAQPTILGYVPPRPARPRLWAAVCALAVVACGCQAPSVQRSDEVARFLAHLDQQAKLVRIDPDTPLALEQCETLALANSLDLRVRNLALEVQDDRVRLALSGGLPNASLLYSDSRRSNPNMVKAAGMETEVAEQRQRALAVQAVLPVLDWGLTYYSYRVAVDKQAQEQLLVARAEQLLRRDVRIAYARHAGAIRQERLARQAHQAAGQVLRVARSLERAQLAVRADTVLVEAALAESALRVTLAEQQIRETHMVLSQLMSLPPAVEFTIVETLPSLPAPPSGEQLERMEDQALRVRPELAYQDRQRQISASTVRQKAAAFFPRLDATGGFNWVSEAAVVNPAFFVGGFQVTHSLLDGGATLWRYKEARKQEDVEKERTMLISLGVLYEVELRALQVREADAVIASARVLEEARREALARIITLYNEGLEDAAGAARSLADLSIQATALDQAQTACLAAWCELEAAALPQVSPTAQAATQPASQPASSPANVPLPRTLTVPAIGGGDLP